jgi:hypothetical protein
MTAAAACVVCHRAIPAWDTPRWACQSCQQRAATQLAALPALYAALDATPGSGAPSVRHPVPHASERLLLEPSLLALGELEGVPVARPGTTHAHRVEADHPAPTQPRVEAVLGYGRAELAPHSDVVLLFRGQTPFGGDTLASNFPQKSLAVGQLKEGRLPLWTARLGCGISFRSVPAVRW